MFEEDDDVNDIITKRPIASILTYCVCCLLMCKLYIDDVKYKSKRRRTHENDDVEYKL